MTSEEKQAFANEAEKALEHELVQDVMEEFADNMGFELAGLPRYGLMKVAMYAATVARAQALGVDPEALRLNPREANSAMLMKAEVARLREGIRAHAYGIAGDTFEERLERNRRLWALLEDADENESFPEARH